MAGSKLSNLPTITTSNLDDADFLYIVDGTPGSTGTLFSNKITVGTLKDYIGAGGGGGSIIIRIKLNDNEGTPVLPSGITFNYLYDLVINGLKSLQLDYDGEIFNLSAYKQTYLEFSFTGSTYVKVIKINDNDICVLTKTDILGSGIGYVVIGDDEPEP